MSATETAAAAPVAKLFVESLPHIQQAGAPSDPAAAPPPSLPFAFRGRRFGRVWVQVRQCASSWRWMLPLLLCSHLHAFMRATHLPPVTGRHRPLQHRRRHGQHAPNSPPRRRHGRGQGRLYASWADPAGGAGGTGRRCVRLFGRVCVVCFARMFIRASACLPATHTRACVRARVFTAHRCMMHLIYTTQPTEGPCPS